MQLNWGLSFIRPQTSLGVALETHKYHHWGGPSNPQQHGFIRSSTSSYPHIEPPARPPGLLIRKRLSKKKKSWQTIKSFQREGQVSVNSCKNKPDWQEGAKADTVSSSTYWVFPLLPPYWKCSTTGSCKEMAFIAWHSSVRASAIFLFHSHKLKKELTCSKAREPKDLWQRLTSIMARVKLPK